MTPDDPETVFAKASFVSFVFVVIAIVIASAVKLIQLAASICC